MSTSCKCPQFDSKMQMYKKTHTLVSLFSSLLLRLYEMFGRSFDFLDPHRPLTTAQLIIGHVAPVPRGVERCRWRTSRSRSPFSACRRGRCARRERGARRWTGQGASSPKPHSETAAADRKVGGLNPAAFPPLPERRPSPAVPFCTSSAARWT